MKIEEIRCNMYNGSEIKILLGKRIKEFRKLRNLTQEQLAEKMEIDQRNLSKIECGNNFITADTLSKLLKALKIEPQELFCFNHHNDESILKKELVCALNNDEINITLLYKLYKAMRN